LELSTAIDPKRLVPSIADDRLRRWNDAASAVEQDPFMALVARVKLLAAAGQVQDAQAGLRRIQSDYPVATIPPDWFRNLLAVSILVGGTTFTQAWLRERYNAPYRLEVEIETTNADPRVVNLRVRGDDARFLVARPSFDGPGWETILPRFADIYPLFDAFMRSSHRMDGTVDINLADFGTRPGLAFSDYRAGYYLIPDAIYMASERYISMGIKFRIQNIPWDRRVPVAFWRGASTGTGGRLSPIGHYPDPTERWRGAPRIRVCQIARANGDIIDAGITKIVQISDPAARDWLREQDLLRDHVDPLFFQQYRYHIDIDGNTNSWPGLFIKLLTGSPVLKVASRLGYQQWYYDRLKPWINFVPVASDLADLVEKVSWLRANDDAARQIGVAGRDLAETLMDDREITSAAPVFAAAMRAARGEPLIEHRFGANTASLDVLKSGWQEPDADGVNAANFEPRIELPKPFGLGDYLLIADVSPAAGLSRHLEIVANGAVLSTATIVERTKISCPLPRSVATAGETLTIGFSLQDHVTDASREHPRAGGGAWMKLHSMAVAASVA
jgi:hypothetical protein